MSDSTFSSLNSSTTIEISPQEKKEKLIREILDYAASGDLRPFIENILSGKLEIDQMDSRGYTAIHLAVWRLDEACVLTLLNKAACPVDILSGSGQTPLMLATVKGSLELIKLFLDRGADIEIKDSLGITPLICAVQSGQLNAFYILLHRGAKIDVKDRNGCGIVHWAAYKNQVTMLRVFKKMGIELDCLDNSKMTGLHRAALSNAIDSVDFLLFSGVSPDILDGKNRTALDIAKENESEGTFNLIVNYSPYGGPIHNYFSYLYFLYWIGIYSVYYLFILPYTVHYLFPSLFFNFSVLWLSPMLM